MNEQCTEQFTEQYTLQFTKQCISQCTVVHSTVYSTVYSIGPITALLLQRHKLHPQGDYLGRQVTSPLIRTPSEGTQCTQWSLWPRFEQGCVMWRNAKDGFTASFSQEDVDRCSLHCSLVTLRFNWQIWYRTGLDCWPSAVQCSVPGASWTTPLGWVGRRWLQEGRRESRGVTLLQ